MHKKKLNELLTQQQGNSITQSITINIYSLHSFLFYQLFSNIREAFIIFFSKLPLTIYSTLLLKLNMREKCQYIN